MMTGFRGKPCNLPTIQREAPRCLYSRPHARGGGEERCPPYRHCTEPTVHLHTTASGQIHMARIRSHSLDREPAIKLTSSNSLQPHAHTWCRPASWDSHAGPARWSCVLTQHTVHPKPPVVACSRLLLKELSILQCPSRVQLGPPMAPPSRR